MGFWLLLGIKGRLMWRSLVRKSGTRTLIGMAAAALVLMPMWLGMAAAAMNAVARRGEQGLLAVVVLVHVSWLFSAFLFAAFAEGFELRKVLRYPVRPWVVFVLNVLLAPFDLVALFLLPPLVAATLAAGRFGGPRMAIAAAAACLLTVLISGVVLHVLLAGLGRFLRKEWARASAGLLLGLALATPSLFLRRHLSQGAPAGALTSSFDAFIEAAARLASRLPTTVPVALLVHGAGAGQWSRVALGVVGAAGLVALGVLLGTRWATAEALSQDSSSVVSARPADDAPSSRWERIFGAELAVLAARDLRYWLRTPQIVLGLAFTPFLVLFFFHERAFSGDLRMFFLPFFCLVSVFNLSANQFGLDREGVRLLLLLPVQPRHLIAAKNLASVVVVSLVTVASLVIVQLATHAALLDLATAALAVLATVPVVLMAGNALSVRHPWRMTFRIGGTPPGALASAFTQMGVVTGMALLLAVPTLLGRLVGGRPLALGGTLGLGLVSWWIWWRSLPGAARSLVARREHLLATLGHAHETG